jgi:hypothetical protein
MDKKTIGIIATVATAFVCVCPSIFSCVWGILISSGQPIDVTVNGVTTPLDLSPTMGYVFLVLYVLLLAVPVGVGFFTLRNKPVDERPPNTLD